VKPYSRGAKEKIHLKGLLFIISGPSGSGKTTLATKVIEKEGLRGILNKSISFTTRMRRSNEKNGLDYYFVTTDYFKKALAAKKILEWTRYLRYYYGTPKVLVDRLLNKGKHVVLCVDLKGVKKLKKLYPGNTVTIFILPPDIRELKSRIEKRDICTDEEEVKQRMKLAKEEMRLSGQFDYCIVNKNLAKSVSELYGIILKRIKQDKKRTL